MAHVEPPSPRSRVSDTSNGLEISIPAKKQVFVILFLIFWLGMWAIGELSAIREVFGPGSPEPFIVFWLGAWALGGIFATGILFWMIAGEEVILVTPSTLDISHRVFGIGRTKSYNPLQIRRLRVSPSSQGVFDMKSSLQFWGIGGGLAAFDYGSSTIKFASGVQEAEAQYIVDFLRPRIPPS